MFGFLKLQRERFNYMVVLAAAIGIQHPCGICHSVGSIGRNNWAVPHVTSLAGVCGVFSGIYDKGGCLFLMNPYLICGSVALQGRFLDGDRFER